MNDSILRERLSTLEHKQWEQWSRTVAKELADIKLAAKNKDWGVINKIIGLRLERWLSYWVPYDALPEKVKDYDREWADKVIEIIREDCAGEYLCCRSAVPTIDGTSERYRWVKKE